MAGDAIQLFRIAAGQMRDATLHFNGLHWAVLMALAAASLAQLYYYSRFLRRIRFSRPWRPLLLRFVAYASLIFLLSGPRWDVVARRPAPMDIRVLVDISQSMLLKDTPNGDSRIDAAIRYAEETMKLPATRATFTAAGLDLKPLPKSQLLKTRAIDADSRITPSVIRSILRKPHPSAIVLLSDGADKSGAPFPAGLRGADGKRVPVITVGVGSPDQKTNLGVSAITAPETAYTGKPLTLRGTLFASNLKGAPVSLELTANGRHARSLRISAPADGRGAPFEFTFTPDRGETIAFSVRARSTATEATTDDNERFAFVRVLESKKRLLYVDSPRWEYPFLKRLLLSRRDIDTSFLPLPPRGSIQSAAPRNLLASAALPRFRMVIVGSAAPALRPAELSALAAYARGGGYLLLLGGANSMLSFNNPPLAACGIRAAVSDDIEGAFFPRLTDSGISDPLLRIDDTLEKNPAAWEALPYLYTFNPVRATAADTLAAHPWKKDGPRGWPLILSSRPGTGRCTALAFEGVWRWKFDPRGADAYDTFFQNIVSEAMRREPSDAATLSISRRNLSPGERVCFDVSTRDAAPKVLVRISRQGSAATALEANRIPSSGVFRACSSFIDAGLYTAQAEAATGVRSTPESFAVELNEMEFQPPSVNEHILKNLASRTGGAYLNPNATPKDLAKAIQKHRITHSERIAVEPWKHAWVFFLIALAPLIEWTIRRREGLT